MNAFKILIGRPMDKIILGRPKHRWENNVKMDLAEIRIKSMNWIQLAEDRDQWKDFVSVAQNLWVP